MTVSALSCHPSPGTSSAPSPFSALLAARASRTPRCRLANLSLVAAADRTGAGVADSVAVPGIRFALGTRLGKPATVVPPEVGATAASATFQPSSAGEVQLAADVRRLEMPDTSSDGRPRRNQSDSTASKIGSLFSSASDAAGGTITPPLPDACAESSGRKPVPDARRPVTGLVASYCSTRSAAQLAAAWLASSPLLAAPHAPPSPPCPLPTSPPSLAAA